MGPESNVPLVSIRTNHKFVHLALLQFIRLVNSGHGHGIMAILIRDYRRVERRINLS